MTVVRVHHRMNDTSRPSGLAGRIDALRDECCASRGRAAGWAAGVPLGVGLWALGFVGPQAAAVVVACALVASWWWLRDGGRAAREADDTVDEVILQGWEKAAEHAVAARRKVLLAPRSRRRLARMRATGVYVPPPPGCQAPPDAAGQAALHRRSLEHVVKLLEDVDRPVDVRGVILVRRLLCDAHEGTMQTGARDEIASALQRIERLI